jgi:hypothetical protein
MRRGDFILRKFVRVKLPWGYGAKIGQLSFRDRISIMELFHMGGVSPNNQSGEVGLKFPDSDYFVVPGACKQAPLPALFQRGEPA